MKYASASRSAAGVVCTEWLIRTRSCLGGEGGAEHEFDRGDRLEFDRFARRLQNGRQVACRNLHSATPASKPNPGRGKPCLSTLPPPPSGIDTVPGREGGTQDGVTPKVDSSAKHPPPQAPGNS